MSFMFELPITKLALPLIPIFMSLGGVINGETGLSMTVVLTMVGGAWYINGRLTSIDDKLKEIYRNCPKIKDKELCD
jgi:hypothetical protein